MPVIYVVPFFALGVVAFLTCLVLPSWRRYALYAFVAPVGFAAGTFGGFILMLVISAFANNEANTLVDVLMAFAYICTGTAGAWISVAIVKHLRNPRKESAVHS